MGGSSQVEDNPKLLKKLILPKQRNPHNQWMISESISLRRYLLQRPTIEFQLGEENWEAGFYEHLDYCALASSGSRDIPYFFVHWIRSSRRIQELAVWLAKDSHRSANCDGGI